MSILLQDLIEIEKPDQYKLHLACWNGIGQPLDDYVDDWKKWMQWNEWRGPKNDLTRERVFSLISFYHEPDQWLFGGMFSVQDRLSNRYKLQLLDDYKEYIGRLKVTYRRKQGMRGRAFYLERYFPEMVVSELLRDPYAGEQFCGYENINHDFATIDLIVRRNRLDWQAALQNVKGVYLITDRKTAKRYVGSAYGDAGIWSRWCCYIGTGHGWNDELTRLIKKKGFSYATQNFVFTLLEYRPMRTDDSEIIARECYWKNVMLSRGQFGYNKN